MTHTSGLAYKIVVVHPIKHKIFMGLEGETLVLPGIRLEAFVRCAKGLTEGIARRYGFHTIQLAVLPDEGGSPPCAIHELLPECHESTEHKFVALSAVPELDLPDNQRAAVAAVMQGASTMLGHFSRLGWLEELRLRLGVDEITGVRQFNSGINFCLLSMECDRRKLWFKGVGEPNMREFGFTLTLAEAFPGYLPAVRLALPEWSAWVMEDVPGKPLHQIQNPDDWANAIDALADMQRGYVHDEESLLKLGAVDWRITRLLAELDQFFSNAERAMAAQTSTTVGVLTRSDLRGLKSRLEDALVDTAASGLPETLVHGDMGHGNLIVSARGPIFLDWAETYVGQPFISSEHLIADLKRTSGISAEETDTLRRHYAQHWGDFLSPAKLRGVMATAPAVAALVYAVTAWAFHRERGTEQTVWPLLRSMARRTKRELETAEGVKL